MIVSDVLEQNVRLDVLPCPLVPAKGTNTDRWVSSLVYVQHLNGLGPKNTNGWNFGKQ